MTKACTLTWTVDLFADIWSKTSAGAPTTNSSAVSLSFGVYSLVTGARVSAQLTTIPFIRLPFPFTITVPERNGVAYSSNVAAKYFAQPISWFTFSTSSSTDVVAQTLHAEIFCNDQSGLTVSFAWPANPSSPGVPFPISVNVANVYNVSSSQLLTLANAQCEITVSVLNANGGSTDSTSYFAILISPPSVSGVPSDIDPVSSAVSTTGYQTTAGKAASWAHVFRNVPDYTALLNAYPVGTTLNGIVHFDIKHGATLSSSGPAAAVLIHAAAYPYLALCLGTSNAAITYVPFSCTVPSAGQSGSVLSAGDTTALVLGMEQDCSNISNSLSCVNCFQCRLSTELTAYNEAGLSTSATTAGIIYDGTKPRIMPFTYTKQTFAGTLWFSTVLHLNFTTNIDEPDSAISSARVTAAILGYEKMVEQTIAADFPLTWDDGTKTSLQAATNHIARNGSTSITMGGWEGVSFHTQLYNVSVIVTASSGQTSTYSETIEIDATNPVAGLVQFSNLVQDANTASATVRVAGFTDPESGILAYWGRLSSTQASNNTDPATDPTWQSLSLLPSAIGPQYFTVNLSQPLALGWTSVIYEIVAANNAYTPGALNNAASLTYMNSWPLAIATQGPTASITAVTWTDLASGSIQDANSSQVSISWMANAVISGIAFVNVNCSYTQITGKTALQSTQVQGNIATGSTEFSIQALSPGSRLVACISVASNTVPPTIISTCQSTPSISSAPAFDGQACTALTFLPQSSTVSVDWSGCTIPLSTDYIQATVIGSVQGDPIGSQTSGVSPGKWSFVANLSPGTYQACLVGFDASNITSFAFCSAASLLDYTAPYSGGQVFSLYAGNGLDPAATPVRLSTNTNAFLVRWDAWEDPESSVTSVSLSLIDMSVGLAVRNVTVPGTEVTYLFTNLALNVGDSYAVDVSATNGVGEVAPKLRSTPVQILGPGSSSESPTVTVLNGFQAQGSANYTFIPTPANATADIHLTWAGFTTMQAQASVLYNVQLLTTGLAAIMSETVQTQQDYMISVLLPPGLYSVQVSLAEIDGSDQVASIANILIAPPRSFISPPVSMSTCITAFSANPSVHLTASWGSFSDPYALMVSQGIAFGNPNNARALSAPAVVLPTDTAFNGTVVYEFGRPTVLAGFSIQCVWSAEDVFGQVYTASFPGTGPNGGVVGIETADAPIVLTLSTWSLASTPASATDQAFFEDVTVTQNSTFAIAFSGFPPLAVQGTAVAQLSYSIGSAASLSGTYDDIVPVTSVVLGIANRASSTYSVLLPSGYHDVILFKPIEFQQFPSSLTPIYACVNVTNLTSGSVSAACSTAIMYDVEPPTAGLVAIDGYSTPSVSSVVYLTSGNDLKVGWSGFLKANWPDNSTGIASFEWSLGSYPGGSDYYPPTSVPSSQLSALAAGMTLMSGAGVYATVTAYDYSGLYATATSAQAIVALDPPVSTQGGIVSLTASPSSNGVNYDVALTFGPFVDTISGVLSTNWLLETAWGLEDVISSTETNTGTLALATNIELSPSQTYICRLTATNNAGLATVLSADLTVWAPLQIEYLVDGQDPENQLHYVTNLTAYTFSWAITGTASKVMAAVGTSTSTQDLQDWTPISTSMKQFTTSVISEISDGYCLFGQLSVRDAAGFTNLIQSTSGVCIDNSPPVAGTVAHGTHPYAHQRFTADTNVITASWNGFSDPTSGISRYYWCIDSFQEIPGCSARCSVVDWTLAALDSRVLAAPLTGGALADGATYIVKVKAVNGPGLSAISCSPPWTVDKSPATGGNVTISYPSADSNARHLSPLWKPPASTVAQQLHLDSSVVRVDWTGFGDLQSGVVTFQVGLFGTPGEVTPFGNQLTTVPGTVTQWIFTGLSLNSSLGSDNQYYAVVSATNGAGKQSQIASQPFLVVDTPPTSGAVEVTSIAANGTSLSLSVNGFVDPNVDIAYYHVLVGTTPYGADWNVQDIAPAYFCASSPCTPTISVSQPLVQNSVYFVTVYAVNVAGLISSPGTSVGLPFYGGASWLVPSADGTFQWAIDCPYPAVSFASPGAVILGGYGLANFFGTENVAVTQFTCVFTAGSTSASSSGTLTASMLAEDSATVICALPTALLSAVGDAQPFHLLVTAPDGSQSLPLNLVRREPVQTWAATTIAGLAPTSGSVARLSNALHAVSWTTTASNIAFFELYVGATPIARFPADARTGLVATPGSTMGSTLDYSLCVSFSGQEATSWCAAVATLTVNNAPPTLAQGVDSGNELILETAVRLNPVGAESAQYSSSAHSLNVDWTGSFAATGQKSLASFAVFLSETPGALTPGLQSVTIPGTVFSTQLTTAQPLEDGGTYYANVIVTDETGLILISWSPPFVSDSTEPLNGTVHFGRPSQVTDTTYQSQDGFAMVFWTGFDDPESGLAGFEVQICSDLQPCLSTGANVGGASQVNLTLPSGSTFTAAVRAQNGVGMWGPWVPSQSLLQVDLSGPPVFEYAFFAGNTSGVAPASQDGLSLVWAATAGSPITEYKVQIGTTRSGPQLMPMTTVGTAKFLPLNLPLTHNTTLYATIMATTAAGDQGGIYSSGLFIDLTKPAVMGEISTMNGAAYYQSSGGIVQVVADWTGVFSDPESGIVAYQWAIGTAGSPTAFTNQAFVSTGLLTQGALAVNVPDGTRLTVSVQATNAASLTTTVMSGETLVGRATPSPFSVTLLNAQVQNPDGSLIPSSIARMRFDGLVDNQSGLANINVLLSAVDTQEVLLNASIGVRTGVDLYADASWLQRPLVLTATAINNFGLTSNASSAEFTITSSVAL
ncbi:hypothetical protein HDU87_005534 [Geranomyces variabilis]|uniref:Fibronectin type-III domain-containing protein n=1 Tax=Geranomyces variabilis TaxID=109894 RepID=A0AAD5TGM6_9FUNG|nr:hypothetical protein HDU87_005534 [Geranomyces variabilis]